MSDLEEIPTGPRPLTLADTMPDKARAALVTGCMTALEASGFVVVEKYEIECLMGFAERIRDHSPESYHDASCIYGRLQYMLRRLQTFEREDAMKRAMRLYPQHRRSAP